MAPIDVEDIAPMEVDDIVPISSDSDTESQNNTEGFRPHKIYQLLVFSNTILQHWDRSK